MSADIQIENWEANPEFEAWFRTLPEKHWARYDLSACRLGWEAGSNAAQADTKRLDWLDEMQSLVDDGDGKEFYQSWEVTASQNYKGIREAIDAGMSKGAEPARSKQEK